MSLKASSKLRWGYSQQRIKEQNTMLLFNLIRSSMPISRASLAEQTGLSPTTVSMLVEEMIEKRWVKENGAGASTMRGRKPIMLEVDGTGGAIATVEVIASGFVCGLYDLRLDALAKERINDAGHTAQSVEKEVLRQLKLKQIAEDKLMSIHVIFPGIYEHDTGRLRFSTVIPPEELADSNLVATLQAQFPLARVFINNNTNVMAYSEFLSDGYTPGTRLLSVCVDEGLSASMVMGDVHKTPELCFPMEIGHIIIDKKGPLCRCGSRGCLETLCSISALFRRMNEEAGLNLHYSYDFGAECNRKSIKKVAEQFSKGNPDVLSVLESYCLDLCCGLVSVVNLLDAHRLHIGGILSELGDKFIELLKKTLSEEFSLIGAHPLVVDSFSGDYESIRKAAVMMAMDELFMEPE